MPVMAILVNLALCLFLVLASGCVRLPLDGSLPEGTFVRKIARVDADAPVALHPDGSKVAITSNGLAIYDAKNDLVHLVSPDRPTTLAWHPDGDRLAAAFSNAKQSDLRLYDLQGKLLSQEHVDGFVTTVGWLKSGEQVAGALIIDRFSFGANMRSIIYRWRGNNKPASTIISDITIRPFISKWPEKELYRTFTFTVSPLGEEIVYTRLQDPPSFKPYLKIIIRQLDSGTELEAGSAAIGSSVPRYAANGDSIVYGTGTKTCQLDPWQEKEQVCFQNPGRAIALSPGGTYRFLDGHLYFHDQEIATFPAISHGEFAAGGTLLVRADDQLYLVSNLKDATIEAPSEDLREKLFSLHKWRSEGLINNSDYTAARERIIGK